jgi:hypothetical protein
VAVYVGVMRPDSALRVTKAAAASTPSAQLTCGKPSRAGIGSSHAFVLFSTSSASIGRKPTRRLLCLPVCFGSARALPAAPTFSVAHGQQPDVGGRFAYVLSLIGEQRFPQSPWHLRGGSARCGNSPLRSRPALCRRYSRREGHRRRDRKRSDTVRRGRSAQRKEMEI